MFLIVQQNAVNCLTETTKIHRLYKSHYCNKINKAAICIYCAFSRL